MVNDFLPISQDDLKKRGWKELDVIIITGDAYVDHPSYGAALIGRVLEAEGFRVGIIAQPDWRSLDDFKKLGKPKLFFAITSGNTDSMVANYTANKRSRKSDEYSPGSKIGLRPDRALIVYANKTREAYKDSIIVLGGIEASLRRLAHYDYWDNDVRRSILVDSKADMLFYGMAENAVKVLAKRLKDKEDFYLINDIRGTVIIRKAPDFLKDYVTIPSFEAVKEDKLKFNTAFKEIYCQMNPFKAKAVVQQHTDRFVVQLPPAYPLKTEEIDKIYGLNFARNWHPVYNKSGGVKGFETVRFSIISHRGCCGNCSFCSLFMHQGRIVQSRSEESVLNEAKLLSEQKDFRGTITDIGGPTANLYKAHCAAWEKDGACGYKSCIVPGKCNNLKLGYEESLQLYKKIAQLPGVRHVFIGSGLRYDLLAEDYAQKYLEKLCESHISGQMKVAPEHIVDRVLQIMNKPSSSVYEKFLNRLDKINKKMNLSAINSREVHSSEALPAVPISKGRRRTYLVNYFISSHPGSGLKEALDLALYLAKNKIHPEQIQDFMPLPMTLAGCIYYTGVNPFTAEEVYSAKTFKERKMQRALIQYGNPKNRQLIREALRILKAEHLFGKLTAR